MQSKDHKHEIKVNKEKTKEKLQRQFSDLILYCVNSMITNKIFKRLIKVGLEANIKLCGPQWCIERFGPFTYKFREKIMEEDSEYFLNFPFTTQLNDMMKDLNIGRSLAVNLLNNLKADARMYLGSDPKLIRAIPKKALRLYCDYVLL